MHGRSEPRRTSLKGEGDGNATARRPIPLPRPICAVQYTKIVTMGRDAATSSKTAEALGPSSRLSLVEILAPYRAISMRCDAIYVRARSAAADHEAASFLTFFRKKPGRTIRKIEFIKSGFSNRRSFAMAKGPDFRSPQARIHAGAHRGEEPIARLRDYGEIASGRGRRIRSQKKGAQQTPP